MTFGWDALGTKRSGMIHMYIHENCPNNNAFAVYVKSSRSSGKEAFTLCRRVPAVGSSTPQPVSGMKSSGRG